MHGEPLTILLVEDNRDHADLVMRTMEDFQVANSIIHVEDGEVALNYLYGRDIYADRTIFPVPHLILLDLRMRSMSGFEVADGLKRFPETETIPVLAMTGFYTMKEHSWLMNFCGIRKCLKQRHDARRRDFDDLGVADRRLYDAGLEEIQLPARAGEGRLDVVGEVGFDELAGEVDNLLQARLGGALGDQDAFERAVRLEAFEDGIDAA